MSSLREKQFQGDGIPVVSASLDHTPTRSDAFGVPTLPHFRDEPGERGVGWCPEGRDVCGL